MVTETIALLASSGLNATLQIPDIQFYIEKKCFDARRKLRTNSIISFKVRLLTNALKKFT